MITVTSDEIVVNISLFSWSTSNLLSSGRARRADTFCSFLPVFRHLLSHLRQEEPKPNPSVWLRFFFFLSKNLKCGLCRKSLLTREIGLTLLDYFVILYLTIQLGVLYGFTMQNRIIMVVVSKKRCYY